MNGVDIQQRVSNEDTNFILRRAVPFLPKPPARMEQQEDARHDDYERSSTLEDKSRRGDQTVNNRDVRARAQCNDIGKIRKDVGHKTVIYFGDSNPRQRGEDRARQPPPETCVRVTPKCNENRETSSQMRNYEMETSRDSIERNDGNDDTESSSRTVENGDSKTVHEFVINISPSREDVLRIEEDESQLEDYWSLPGDTSGFKADWSFVQQWRLRG